MQRAGQLKQITSLYAGCSDTSIIRRTHKQISGGSIPRSRLRGQQSRSAVVVMAATASIEDQIKEKNEKYPIMIYAKSYCPFCSQVKGLFNKLQVDFMSVNLDEIHEGQEIQDALAGITGSSTVPQVFIKGEFIGGCDETVQKNNNGQLKELLGNAGIEAKA